jgi:prepilin-type N-terminal cleavage/methylation domain-containing protein
MRATRLAGFSLLEILLVLVLAGILTAIAVPPLSTYLQRVRMRSVLDRFTTDLYHARMIAARSGERIHFRLEPGHDGCVLGYEVRRAESGEILRRVDLGDTPSVCLTISGNNTLSINSRGMPVGAARTVRVTGGSLGDSLRISIVGRVNRLYSTTHAVAPRIRKIVPIRQGFRGPGARR